MKDSTVSDLVRDSVPKYLREKQNTENENHFVSHKRQEQHVHQIEKAAQETKRAIDRNKSFDPYYKHQQKNK